VNKLKSDGVFAREVNSSGVAFHSWYIAAAGPVFREKVSGVNFSLIFIYCGKFNKYLNANVFILYRLLRIRCLDLQDG